MSYVDAPKRGTVARSLACDLSSSVMTQVVTVSVGIAQGVMLARLLGPERRGSLALLMTVPALVLAFSDMGVRQASTRAIGSGRERLETIVGTAGFLWLIASGMSLCLAALFMHGQGFWRYGIAAVCLALTLMPVRLLTQYGRGILLGLRRINSANLARMFAAVVTSLLVLALARSVEWALAAIVLGGFLELLVVVWLLRPLMPSSPIVSLSVARRLVRDGIRYAIALAVMSSNYKISLLALGWFGVADRSIGHYAVAAAVSELVWQIPTAMGLTIFSYSASERDSTEFSLTVIQLLRQTLAIGFFFCVVYMVVAPYLLVILYGRDYAESGLLVRLLMPGVYAGLTYKLLQADLAGRGRPLVAARTYLGVLALNPCLACFLIPACGVAGASVATSISYVCGAVLFAAAYQKETGIRVFRMLVQSNPIAGDR